MTEILTESFCERCGTRYTFQSTAPRGGRLDKIKFLSRGLKNYVLSDETTLDEAFSDARNVTDRQASIEQLDAFHKTFNFCMSCRQYTCTNCWNETEGRCLSCAPSLGPAPISLGSAAPEFDPLARVLGGTVPGNGHPAGNGHGTPTAPEPSTWPTTDLAARAGSAPSAPSSLEELFGRTAHDEPLGTPPVDASDGTPVAPAGPSGMGWPVTDGIARSAAERAAAADALADALGDLEPEPIAATIEEPAGPAETAVAGSSAVGSAEPEIPERVAAAEGPEETATAAAPGARPEIDERAAAAAAQTHSLLDKFRARPMPAEPGAEARPVAAAAPIVPRPAISTPPPASLPFAAIAPQPIPPEPARHSIGEPVTTPIQPIAAHPADQPATGPQPLAGPPAAEHEVQPTWPTRAPTPTPATPQPGQAPAPAGPPQPVWRMIAPESAPTPTTHDGRPQRPIPPAMPAPAPSGAEPQWPTAPAWPASRASRNAAADAVWAESSRDLLARPESGVQACFNCGLALSATARFCRRCGTSQVRS